MAEAGYPDGDGFGKLEIHTWKAGDVPFLPEQAQLIADMWEKNLGIDVEVIVGEAATVREPWYNRQLDGKVIVRANETRWDGGSITNAIYGDPEGSAHLGGRRDDLIAVAKEALRWWIRLCARKPSTRRTRYFGKNTTSSVPAT